MVAEGMCRLLVDRPYNLFLVDYDRVEPHNLKRQSFFKSDIGKFKSQVLAERLSKLYERPIRYSVMPFEPDMLYSHQGNSLASYEIHGILIGCVDTPEARRQIAVCMKWHNWWIDAGNSHDSGQVFIGNSLSASDLIQSFDEMSGEVSRLPAPSLQEPSLLVPISNTVDERRDCAEEVEDWGQSPVINQAMASLVLEFIYKLLRGQLSWIAAYLDLESGSLRTVPADPETISRMYHIPQKKLISPGYCSRGILMSPGQRRALQVTDLVET